MSVEAHEAQKMVYVIGMAVGGLIEAMGMHAENQDRLSHGLSIAYTDEAFDKVRLDNGLHHNSLMTNIYP